MAERIYGVNPMTGDLKPGAGNAYKGITDYLRSRGHLFNQNGDDKGLAVFSFTLTRASERNWHAVVDAGGVMSASVSWRNPNGGNFKHPKVGQVLHAFASAGQDEDRQKIVFAHGWGDHPGDQPPFKKPPYAAGETPYIDEYPYELATSFKRMKIPKTEGVDLFSYAADHVLVDRFYAVLPRGKSKMSGNFELLPGTGLARYSYEVENMDFDPIFQLALQVDVPFSLADVMSPDGWSATLWNSVLTPDITPDSVFAPELGVDQDGINNSEPTLGILWSTESLPVLSNSSLAGFSYTVSDKFLPAELASLTILSDGRSLIGDPDSEGLVSEINFTLGPSASAPEPGTAWLVLLGALLELAGRVSTSWGGSAQACARLF